MLRRSPEAIAQSKRTKEGQWFERSTVPDDLRDNGYTVVFAHQSRGAVDIVAWKPGQILVIAARLTSASKVNPSFDDAEWDGVWELAAGARPGFQVVPLFATAQHAARPGKPCVCSAVAPDRVRYLRLTGPSSLRGAGRRPPWEPFQLDEVAEAAA